MCSQCSGAGWIWDEVEVEEVDADGDVVRVDYEWEQITCPWCGGDGLEPLEPPDYSPGWWKATKRGYSLLKRLWGRQ